VTTTTAPRGLKAVRATLSIGREVMGRYPPSSRPRTPATITRPAGLRVDHPKKTSQSGRPIPKSACTEPGGERTFAGVGGQFLTMRCPRLDLAAELSAPGGPSSAGSHPAATPTPRAVRLARSRWGPQSTARSSAHAPPTDHRSLETAGQGPRVSPWRGQSRSRRARSMSSSPRSCRPSSTVRRTTAAPRTANINRYGPTSNSR
jgi:hypothetical protein